MAKTNPSSLVPLPPKQLHALPLQPIDRPSDTRMSDPDVSLTLLLVNIGTTVREIDVEARLVGDHGSHVGQQVFFGVGGEDGPEHGFVGWGDEVQSGGGEVAGVAYVEDGDGAEFEELADGGRLA